MSQIHDRLAAGPEAGIECSGRRQSDCGKFVEAPRTGRTCDDDATAGIDRYGVPAGNASRKSDDRFAAGSEAGIDGSVGIETGDCQVGRCRAPAANPGRPGNHNLARGVDRDGIGDRVVLNVTIKIKDHFAARSECRIDAAVGIKPHHDRIGCAGGPAGRTGDDNPAKGIDRHGIDVVVLPGCNIQHDVTVRAEARVDAAIRIQLGQSKIRTGAARGRRAGNDDLSVGRNRHARGTLAGRRRSRTNELNASATHAETEVERPGRQETANFQHFCRAGRHRIVTTAEPGSRDPFLSRKIVESLMQ